MTKKLFVANWKSHKTNTDVISFLEKLKERIHEVNMDNKEIIICPSFPFLSQAKAKAEELSLPIRIGAQNVSNYDEGAYTGEVAASQLVGIVEYVIIGHSERKRYQHEVDSDIEQKIARAKEARVSVIQCIQDENSRVFEGATIVAYEPPTAISTFGTGQPDSPEHIQEVFSLISATTGDRPLLYGGSVNEENVSSYLEIESCSGLLIGGASLEVDSFVSLLLKW